MKMARELKKTSPNFFRFRHAGFRSFWLNATGDDIERPLKAVRLDPDATWEELRETLGLEESIPWVDRLSKAAAALAKKTLKYFVQLAPVI